MSSFVSLEDVKKIYQMGEVQIMAAAGIDFQIERGEFAVVVGPSGAGKTTVLNILGGMDTASSGRVIVDGKDIAQYSPRQLTAYRRDDIGFVFQFYNLIPILNVVENITLPCRLDGKEVKEERLEELLEILNLKNRKEHLPNQLSGGQQQRVSIGRAIVNYPAIVLADEPTGNLDSKASREIIDLLKMSNQKYNQTVIVITHDENIALEADRILTIDDGKIVKDERVR